MAGGAPAVVVDRGTDDAAGPSPAPDRAGAVGGPDRGAPRRYRSCSTPPRRRVLQDRGAGGRHVTDFEPARYATDAPVPHLEGRASREVVACRPKVGADRPINSAAQRGL
ncbi:hypothetical protein PA7_29690 [Pseudonocardia asaccharolytica DSM 44247 = NBRC 16224]|uniref:Uncharacterized protein n=1 Tax=Pseudonocardia asaccharolytica DSM 44247 = NBRC 16224 TaxID=1123024 RepID=A0A511D2X0_9PSEU|nr:hypothetical protein PA7_29690 [Pseudonocardia asaccharolytica DSM 44247 = NBRC 16224]